MVNKSKLKRLKEIVKKRCINLNSICKITLKRTDKVTSTMLEIVPNSFTFKHYDRQIL